LDEANNVVPTGMKTIPITKKIMITLIGVNIGCHDAIRCCLNGVSVQKIINPNIQNIIVTIRAPGFFFSVRHVQLRLA
jgi:hypothetical protein